MNFSKQDPVSMLKALEEDMNRAILEVTNSSAFTKLMGKDLEMHADYVVKIKQLANEWLNCKGIASRDETANLALTIVKYERTLDELENELYFSTEKYKENKNRLIGSRKKLEQLLNELYFELNTVRKQKRQSLSQELEDLKQLFLGGEKYG